MNTNRANGLFLLKAIGLFMGACFFAWSFDVGMHELGHYLANIFLGVPERGIILNAFGSNYNIYLGDLSVALGTPLRKAFSGASGPLFNLLVSATVSLLLWRKRSPVRLPLLMLGSIALLQESVGMIMEMIEGFGDWTQVGIPPVIIMLLAVILLAVGCIWMLQLLPLVGINSMDPLWRKLVVFLAGIPLFFLCSVIYQTLFGSDIYVPTWGIVYKMEWVRKSKLIFLAVSTVLTLIITPLHRPLFSWLDRLSHTPIAQVRWRDTMIAIGLAFVIIIAQLVLFNEGAAVVAG